MEAIETIRPALRLHQRYCRSCYMIHAAQIDVESVIPGLIVDLEQGLSRIDAGIVDQDIEPAELPAASHSGSRTVEKADVAGDMT